jgi:uncharacterized membrane protein YhaH (DUF805 family)
MDSGRREKLKHILFGRMRRRHFSLYLLINLAAIFVLNDGPPVHEAVIIKNLLAWQSLGDANVKLGRYLDAAIWILVVLGLSVAILVLYIRRFHDIGLPWYLAIVKLAVEIGLPILIGLQGLHFDSKFLTLVLIALFVGQAGFLIFMPGQRGENRYGPPPGKALFNTSNTRSFVAKPLFQNAVIAAGIFGSIWGMLILTDQANQDLRQYNWRLYSFQREISRPIDAVRVVANSANIRSAPDTSAAILKTVPRGSFLERKATIGEWIAVRTFDGSIEGYVRSDLVEQTR